MIERTTEKRLKTKWLASSLSTLALGAALAGCGGGTQTASTAPGADAGNEGGTDGAPATQLTGSIKVDGSSTVFPITEAVAEEFGKSHPGLKVTVGVSGTGGGFKKFAAGEAAISNASRPIE